MATSVDLSLSGLASGFDWKAFVDQMVAAERAPETTLRTQQSQIQQRNSAFSSIATQLTTLQTQIDALKDPAFYDNRIAQTSDSSIGSATAAGGTPVGSYSFSISQLATPSKFTGTGNVGAPLSATTDFPNVPLAAANFPTAITSGTFTVNGGQVAIATTDTLQEVFDKIAVATSNQVTASYDSTTDKIQLSSSEEIVLGTATDTSNFLRAARLANNGTGAVSSSLPLGSIEQSAALASAGFTTTVSDGGAGTGEFKINGVSIKFDASTDSVSAILGRINDSNAGVNASYDSLSDRFVLTSKATGDLGIALEDVSGNFLSATGLASGTLSRGKNLVYTLNGGEALTSMSNTISEDSSGIAGLSVTASEENATVTITVGSDTSKVRTAIQAFVDAYNKVQSTITSLTASSTSSTGVVSAGVLASDSTAGEIASKLRSGFFSAIGGLEGQISHLADLGFQTNGYDNQLALSDSGKLDAALSGSLSEVKQLFSDPTNGFAVKLHDLVEHLTRDEGTLKTHQANLTKRSSSIDAQIATMEKSIAADRKRMTQSFVAMETAQAKINQELAYLTKNFA